MRKKERERLVRQVEESFSSTAHKVHTQDIGCQLLVSATYEDSISTEQMRKKLMGISPAIRVGSLERTYSNLCQENALGVMVAQWMEHRTVHHGIPDLHPTL